MRKTYAALIGASSLAAAGSAGADVIVFQETGSTTVFEETMAPLPGPGRYRFEGTSSIPVTFQLDAGYEDHWDIFLAPPPRPHAEFIEGNDSDYAEYSWATATAFSYVFVVPEIKRVFSNAPDWYADAFGIAGGTLIYREDRADDPWWSIYVDDVTNGSPFDYSFKVVQLSAVPEPATWAMMIVGFGLAGAALRHRRPRYA